MAIYTDLNYKFNTINKDIKLDKDNQAIKNAIRNVLTIRKGTLPGNPEFGTTLENSLFSIMDEVTYSLIEEIVIEDLEKWEPRIYINNVNVYGILETQQIVVELEYSILKTNEVDTYKLLLN